ncbi:hypothetical protein J3F84DRAFT_376268 [Trichoderma pleuroticola]
MPRLLEAPAEGRRRYCQELGVLRAIPRHGTRAVLCSSRDASNSNHSTLLLLRSVRGRVPAARASQARFSSCRLHHA